MRFCNNQLINLPFNNLLVDLKLGMPCGVEDSMDLTLEILTKLSIFVEEGWHLSCYDDFSTSEGHLVKSYKKFDLQKFGEDQAHRLSLEKLSALRDFASHGWTIKWFWDPTIWCKLEPCIKLVPYWMCEHFTLDHHGVEKGGWAQARYHKNLTWLWTCASKLWCSYSDCHNRKRWERWSTNFGIWCSSICGHSNKEQKGVNKLLCPCSTLFLDKKWGQGVYVQCSRKKS